MTRQQEDTIISTILEIINENGLHGIGEAVSILINEAMKIERSSVLNAKPWERTEYRTGYANGFKNKSIASKPGRLHLNVPQIMGNVDFYPSALDKRRRSEKALNACHGRDVFSGGINPEGNCGFEKTLWP